MPKKFSKKLIISFKELSSFQEKVYKTVRKIPKGKTITYKMTAKLAGYPRAWRAVGNVLNKNLDPKKIPCHRVIKSDGEIGGYNKGIKKKIALLRGEGMVIINGRVVNQQ